MLRDELLERLAHRRAPGRAAPRHRPRRLARGRALPRAAQAAALLERPDGQDVADALPESTRAWPAATAEQREIFQTERAGRVPARRRARRATPGRGDHGARGAFARGRSCPAAARDWRFRPPTSRPTGSARCATSSRGSSASPRSRRSTSASGSSSTRCSSASTPAAGPNAGRAARPARRGLAPRRLRRLRARSASCARRPRTR